ncbi:MAG TPA: AAA family ATPase [Phycisphaerae bacterium]|nr:AAA family ATPase [Phycisphaerae bacterium]
MIEFLRDMFGEAVTPERRLTVFTTPDLRTMRFAGLDAVEGHALDASGYGREVYFGLGLIRGSPQGRGTAEDVAAIGALWCDIDMAGPAHPGKALPASIEEVEALLGELPLAPSVVVDSGHGAHAYWLLKEPWVFDDEADRRRAAGLARAWHGLVCRLAEMKGWKLENLGGLARVLRLPGTVNHKLPEQPVEVRVLRGDPGLRYSPGDFEEFASAGDDTAQAAGVAVAGDLVLRPDAEPPVRRMIEAAAVSPKFVETWSRKRTDLTDQSQSSYDLSLATIAAMLRWTDQEIADLVIAARREHNEKPEKALRRDYITRTLARARQAAAEMPVESADVDISAITGQAAGSTNGGPAPPTAITPAGGLRIDTVCLADVEPEPVHWLWPDRFALGKLSLIAGEPGLGKSFLTLDMAARVSRGAGWPCNEAAKSVPAGVVLLSAEDDIKDTIAPRLIAAGADRSRILAMRALYQPQLALVPGVEKQVPFSLLEHIPQLEELIRRAAPCRLVIVDPVSAFLGGTDSHNNSEVRGVLAPLAEMAARNRVAVVAVTHLNKGQGSALNRVIGSIAFTAAARAAYVVTKDEDDPARRLLLPVKNNLGIDLNGFAYRLASEPTPHVEWEPQPVAMSADEAVGGERRTRGPDPDARQDAEVWLLDFLSAGPRTAQEIFTAARVEGHTRVTVKRAKATAGIQSVKQDFDGPWVWVLPGSGPLMTASRTPAHEGDHQGAQPALCPTT